MLSADEARSITQEHAGVYQARLLEHTMALVLAAAREGRDSTSVTATIVLIRDLSKELEKLGYRTGISGADGNMLIISW